MSRSPAETLYGAKQTLPIKAPSKAMAVHAMEGIRPEGKLSAEAQRSLFGRVGADADAAAGARAKRR